MSEQPVKKPRKPRVQKPITDAHLAQIKAIRIDAPKGNDYSIGIGRPTDYKPEYAQAMLDYFRVGKPLCLVKGADAQGNPKIVSVDFMSFDDFADSIDVSYRSLYNWYTAINADGKPTYPEFFSAYEHCKTIQSSLIVRGGLTGAYKAGFATLAAMNIMGWKTQIDTQNEHHHTSESVERLAKITEENQRKSVELMDKVKQRKENG